LSGDSGICVVLETRTGAILEGGPVKNRVSAAELMMMIAVIDDGY
jgi:hypothetical protein